MTTDLVKRLRSRESISQLNPGRAVALCEEAAAEIERLRGENEVTAADLHAWMKLKADAEARLAEAVKLLWEAPIELHCYGKCCDGTSNGPCDCQPGIWQARRNAFLAVAMEGRS